MESHLNKHFNDIRNLTLEYNTVKDKLQGDIGSIFTDIMLKSISKPSHKEELESFRIKKSQFFNLTKRSTKNVDFKVPVINLSNYQLNENMNETIIRTGATCKKIACEMRDSACRWFIVK